jgi:hypothetical protein
LHEFSVASDTPGGEELGVADPTTIGMAMPILESSRRHDVPRSDYL